MPKTVEYKGRQVAILGTPKQRRLSKSMEESGELVQAGCKWQIHGPDSTWDNGETNVQAYEREAGDVLAILSLMMDNGDIDRSRVYKHVEAKIKKLKELGYDTNQKG